MVMINSVPTGSSPCMAAVLLIGEDKFKARAELLSKLKGEASCTFRDLPSDSEQMKTVLDDIALGKMQNDKLPGMPTEVALRLSHQHE